MHKNFYEVEVGIHLTDDNEEFDSYAVADVTNETNLAYYDENQVAFFEYKKALDFANNYVKNGVKNTYAFIYLEEYNFSSEQIEEVNEFGTFDVNYITIPPISEWLYYIYKDENGNIITQINKGE